MSFRGVQTSPGSGVPGFRGSRAKTLAAECRLNDLDPIPWFEGEGVVVLHRHQRAVDLDHDGVDSVPFGSDELPQGDRLGYVPFETVDDQMHARRNKEGDVA
jgi:hypothetical protein